MDIAKGIARRHLHSILLSVVVLLISACAQTGDDFMVNERYEAAADLYTQSAEQGDVTKMMTLAGMYSTGKINYRRDYPQAVYWYTKAAEQGVVSAKYELGFIYEYGQGEVGQDIDQAIHWYQQAAEQDHAYSQYRLANLLAQKITDYQDEAAIEADQWFVKAALMAERCSNDALCTIVQQDLFNYRWRLERFLTASQKEQAQQQVSDMANPLVSEVH